MQWFKTYQAILWGGLSAGTLDILAAIISNRPRGVNAIRVLQSVASGLLGADAFKGGNKTAAIGLFCHFAIAFIWTIVYFLISHKLRFLTERWLLSAALYGTFVYFFMNLVVVRLSAAPFKIPFALTGLLIHIFCIGFPLAFAMRGNTK